MMCMFTQFNSHTSTLRDQKHFFLDCPIYIQARTILIGNINRVTTCYTLDIEFLTCGNNNLIKIKMDSYDVHVHPIQFQLYNKESF
jgi:hypothetical protein